MSEPTSTPPGAGPSAARVAPTWRVQVVRVPSALAQACERLASAVEIPLDVESNGLHAYQATLCTAQLAVVREAGAPPEEVIIVDAVALSPRELAPLSEILGPRGPRKILHDLSFDARMLARAGLVLGGVFDTSVAARFLGVTSLGLSTLAAGRLGVTLPKDLQQHDWRRRPLTPTQCAYLADDVAYLSALARGLEVDVDAIGIREDVEVETAYRLERALAETDGGVDPRPPYVRIKGSAALPPPSLAVLRHVAVVRESHAERADVPPFKLVGNDVLLDLARRPPRDLEELRARPAMHRGRGASIARELFAAVLRGSKEGDIPPEDRARYFTPSPAPVREWIDARRRRERRLMGWRRAEAKARGVDEQVVLPGHCLQDIADLAPTAPSELATIGGFGDHRIARYAAAVLAALSTSTSESDPP